MSERRVIAQDDFFVHVHSSCHVVVWCSCRLMERGESLWTPVTPSRHFFPVCDYTGAFSELLHHWLDPRALPLFSLDCVAKPSCQPMWRGQAQCETFKFIREERGATADGNAITCLIDKEATEVDIPPHCTSERNATVRQHNGHNPENTCQPNADIPSRGSNSSDFKDIRAVWQHRWACELSWCVTLFLNDVPVPSCSFYSHYSNFCSFAVSAASWWRWLILMSHFQSSPNKNHSTVDLKCLSLAMLFIVL